MKPAPLLRSLLLLILVGVTGLAPALAESREKNSPVPTPYSKQARFSRKYDPKLQPEHPAKPALLAPMRYPERWRKWGQPAYAVVEFLILPTGRTAEIQCTEATDRAFAKEAERVVEFSMFVPALKNQQGVCSKWVQRFEFKLPPATPPAPTAPATPATPAASASPSNEAAKP